MKYFPSYEYIKESSFDGYVVGSDQVWRKEFILDFLCRFFYLPKDGMLNVLRMHRLSVPLNGLMARRLQV